MGRAAALLVLRAYTGIHAGSGQELGTVDLPIQRERVTNYPVVRGSSLKGALRQSAQEKWQAAGQGEWDDSPQKDLLEALFGPETQQASEFGGAVCVGDANLLLFPMRSLRGTFAWLTCPLVVRRLRRNLVDTGIDALIPDKLSEVPKLPSSAHVTVCKGSGVSLRKPGSQAQSVVVLEDFGLDVSAESLDPLAKHLGGVLPDPDSELTERLVLASDQRFQDFTTFCTEVVTRVQLADETKTVVDGNLWTEELLPAESVLTALVLCSDDRKGRAGEKRLGLDMLVELKNATSGRFQIGGNETVGYGICQAHWLGPVALGAGLSNGGGG